VCHKSGKGPRYLSQFPPVIRSLSPSLCLVCLSDRGLNPIILALCACLPPIPIHTLVHQAETCMMPETKKQKRENSKRQTQQNTAVEHARPFLPERTTGGGEMQYIEQDPNIPCRPTYLACMRALPPHVLPRGGGVPIRSARIFFFVGISFRSRPFLYVSFREREYAACLLFFLPVS